MIVYLDASALVKRYVAEVGSKDVDALIVTAATLGTGVISRTEVVAALARAFRSGVVTRRTATRALAAFTTEWDDLFRLQLTEPLAVRAGELAWEHGLRGYDAVHLAIAVYWQDRVGDAVTLATYDRALWKAARGAGLNAWPEDPR